MAQSLQNMTNNVPHVRDVPTKSYFVWVIFEHSNSGIFLELKRMDFLKLSKLLLYRWSSIIAACNIGFLISHNMADFLHCFPYQFNSNIFKIDWTKDNSGVCHFIPSNVTREKCLGPLKKASVQIEHQLCLLYDLCLLPMFTTYIYRCDCITARYFVNALHNI